MSKICCTFAADFEIGPMKKKILTRINIALGSAIFVLMGMSGCERQVKYGPDPGALVKYGCPPEEEVIAMYGVTMPIDEPQDNF